MPIQCTCVRCARVVLRPPSEAAYNRSYCSRECYFADRRQNTFAERVAKKIDPNGPIHPYNASLGPCARWTGRSIGVEAYGTISLGRKEDGAMGAHRAVWLLAGREIPKGLFLLHSCDRRWCVNLDHLRVGDYKDNAADMVARHRGFHDTKPERQARGERIAAARLTSDQVRQIRETYRAGGTTMAQLSQAYGMDDSQICRIINRQAWKHIA